MKSMPIGTVVMVDGVYPYVKAGDQCDDEPLWVNHGGDIYQGLYSWRSSEWIEEQEYEVVRLKNTGGG